MTSVLFIVLSRKIKGVGSSFIKTERLKSLNICSLLVKDLGEFHVRLMRWTVDHIRSSYKAGKLQAPEELLLYCQSEIWSRPISKIKAAYQEGSLIQSVSWREKATCYMKNACVPLSTDSYMNHTQKQPSTHSWYNVWLNVPTPWSTWHMG